MNSQLDKDKNTVKTNTPGGTEGNMQVTWILSESFLASSVDPYAA